MKILLLAAVLFAADTEPLFELETAFETVKDAYNASFTDDGKLLVGSTLWDMASGQQTGVFKREGPVLSPGGALGFIKEEKTSGYKKIAEKPEYIVEASAVSNVYLWDAAKNKKGAKLGKFKFHCTPTTSGFQPVTCPTVRHSFSPDGKRLVLNVPAGDWGKHRATMPRYFPLDGWKSYSVDEKGRLKELPGYAFFLRDGRLASLMFNASGAVEQVIETETGKTIVFPRNAWYKPVEYRLSADGSVLAMRYYYGHESASRRLQIWSMETGAMLLDEYPRNEPYFALAADGSWALITHYDGTKNIVRGFDLRAGGRERPVPAMLKASYLLVPSPDGKHLVADPPGAPVTVYRILGPGAPAAPKPVVAAATNVDNPPAAKLPLDPNAYAVVIGVEKYRQEGIPKVDFAARDAATVHRYLTESLGFDAANVMLLQNEQATKADLETYLGPWLKNRVNEKSRVFVYYAGHGAPNPATGQGYLMPYEGDPNYTESKAYPIQALYDTLAKLPAKDVTVVLDACFSGSGGRSLLAKGARPLVTQSVAKAGGNTSVISAASGAQISASYPQGRHGLLTYFLLEGLHGAADVDKDGAVTTAELFGYARPAVEREARKQNLEQTPTMTGAGATVWLKK